MSRMRQQHFFTGTEERLTETIKGNPGLYFFWLLSFRYTMRDRRVTTERILAEYKNYEYEDYKLK